MYFDKRVSPSAFLAIRATYPRCVRYKRRSNVYEITASRLFEAGIASLYTYAIAKLSRHCVAFVEYYRRSFYELNETVRSCLYRPSLLLSNDSYNYQKYVVRFIGILYTEAKRIVRRACAYKARANERTSERAKRERATQRENRRERMEKRAGVFARTLRWISGSRRDPFGRLLAALRFIDDASRERSPSSRFGRRFRRSPWIFSHLAVSTCLGD